MASKNEGSLGKSATSVATDPHPREENQRLDATDDGEKEVGSSRANESTFVTNSSAVLLQHLEGNAQEASDETIRVRNRPPPGKVPSDPVRGSLLDVFIEGQPLVAGSREAAGAVPVEEHGPGQRNHHRPCLASSSDGQVVDWTRNGGGGSSHHSPAEGEAAASSSSSVSMPPAALLRRSGSSRLHHPHHPPHHPHHAHEPSLNDLASLMREQDAELLESLAYRSANEDDANVDTTPTRITHAGGGGGPSSSSAAVAATAAATATGSLPPLALEPAASLDESALSTTMSTSVLPSTASMDRASVPSTDPPPVPHRPTSSSTRRGSTRPTSLRTMLVRHESAGGTGGPGAGTSDDKSVSSAFLAGMDEATVCSADGSSAGGERSRRALSGEIWVETNFVAKASVLTAKDVQEATRPLLAVPPVDARESVRHYHHPESLVLVTEDGAMPPSSALSSAPVSTSSITSSEVVQLRRGMVRSESMDRRLNEAAQFAEAVGELRLGEEEELRIIEEDQDLGAYDTDDDDDATEIHVEGDEILDLKKPRKVVEFTGVPMGEVTFLQPEQQQHHHPHKVRPQWPFRTQRTKGGFLDKLPENGATASQDFVYKGIRSNPPEIVKRGITRGNYSVLHRKAWLECTDKYHRYGKNLRLYYRFWERLGFPTNMFFDWLDSKGEAAGQPLPELEDCPRSQLDSDTVLYIADEKETNGYALDFIVDDTGKARVIDADKELVRTGADGWIFVLRDNVLYGAQKITSVKGHCKQRFHHSSFFGGKAVAAAGIFITDDDGGLQQVLPHSGHYRPGEAHMQRMLFFLHNQGVDLWSFQVDMQQILHVARDAPVDGSDKTEKKKKIETLRMIPAGLVACYLAHKARFIGEGIFAQIHRIKRADVATVTEALELIDDGSIVGRASSTHLDVTS